MQLGILVMIVISIGGCAGFMDKLSHDRKKDRLFAIERDQRSVDLALTEYTLSNPNVSKRCEPWKTNGNELIEAHCIWTIQGSPKWQKQK
ncbi:MAG: hypothetical protein K2Q26_08930 [Bdellovibrionales bacterium]|nr:hypothetical protein [Bdellovibrionales bacterium]